MIREFEGKTETEAIDAAVRELGLEPHQFEVELLDQQKSGLFGRGKGVRIRVHVAATASDATRARRPGPAESREPEPHEARNIGVSVQGIEPETDIEHAIVDFVTQLTEKMGYPADVQVVFRESAKLGLRLDSQHASMLIGRKGKNLEAIQILCNSASARLGAADTKVIIDSEGYRGRREEQLIRLAHKVGDQVQRTRGSKLLEPMNPFERRLVHTALNDIANLGTESEGEGLYKQVRIFYRGSAS